jgi:hypothetical protein
MSRERTGSVARAAGRTAAALSLAAFLAPLAGRAQRLVPTADPGHPRLKYADSLTSLNDRCMVRQAKLNPKVRPVYVNRQPVGFC